MSVSVSSTKTSKMVKELSDFAGEKLDPKEQKSGLVFIDKEDQSPDLKIYDARIELCARKKKKIMVRVHLEVVGYCFWQ